MTGKAGVKAGLIGAAVLVVLALLNLIPVVFLRLVCCVLILLAYVGIGVLAGSYLTPPRNAGGGAGAGAIAGLIGGAAFGIASTIISAVQAAIGVAGAVIDPDLMRQFTELGVDIDPEILTLFAGAGGVVIGGSLCCLGSLAIGAVLGAIGGAVFGAAKSD